MRKSKQRKGMALCRYFWGGRPVCGRCTPAGDEQNRSPGDAQLIADVKEVLFDMPLSEPIGCNHVVGSQLATSAEIQVLGPFDQPGELHILDHAFSNS
jgi:hypothetical protein